MTRDDVFNLLMRQYPNLSWQDLHKSKYVIKVKDYYWRPNSCGYGPLHEAGLYDFDFAANIVCNQRDARDQMIPIQTLRDELIEIIQGSARLLRDLI